MKKLLAYILTGAVVVGGAILVDQMLTKKKVTHIFDPAIDQVVGDENGVVCHDVYLQAGQSGKRVPMTNHRLWKEDFRTLMPEQKREVLTQDIEHDMEDAGLACYTPSGLFLSEAYAQRHNPGGGGCSSHSCAAKVNEPFGCSLGGTSCVITIVCCPGDCPPQC